MNLKDKRVTDSKLLASIKDKKKEPARVVDYKAASELLESSAEVKTQGVSSDFQWRVSKEDINGTNLFKVSLVTSEGTAEAEDEDLTKACWKALKGVVDLQKLQGSKAPVVDGLVTRKVGGKDIQVKELPNSEEAKKFLNDNPGYTAVDEENGKVYVAISA